MSVFDDPKKELEALQAQIEAQEDWFEKELDSAKRMIGDVPRAAQPTSAAAGIPARRSPAPAPVRTVQVRQEPAPVQPEPRKKGIRGLVILAVLELLGIAGIAAYWLLYLL
jgi:hypothetical protein